LGYAAGDRGLMNGLIRIRQYTTVCAYSFAQWGRAIALNSSQKVAEKMVAEFDRRRKLLTRMLGEIRGVPFLSQKVHFTYFPT